VFDDFAANMELPAKADAIEAGIIKDPTPLRDHREAAAQTHDRGHAQVAEAVRSRDRFANKRWRPVTSNDQFEGSKSLTDLAYRIKAEHEAAASALDRGAQHARNAGDLLIEAKAQLEHGQWLPWLVEHCEIPEKTAQRYMRMARARQSRRHG
jgi:hypothetical protein